MRRWCDTERTKLDKLLAEYGIARHPTKLVQFGDQQADIDVDIADLVLNLWKLGLSTCNSCQDNGPERFVWIEFSLVCDAEKFLNFVAEYSEKPGSVYDRMTRAWGNATDLDWQYSPGLDDFGVEMEYPNDDTFIPRFARHTRFNFFNVGSVPSPGSRIRKETNF
jgi:hypothetical protein